MSMKQQPIGVFDSGIGGLSVLQALLDELPHEHFVYLADSGHAPYGEKPDSLIRQRSHSITQVLLQQPGIKALVVACNTATAVAIDGLRHSYPQLPIVGVEPALKPAPALSRTGRVGVMATRGTVESARFARLLHGLQPQAEFVVRACDGLALAIENTTRADTPERQAWALQQVDALLQSHTAAMGPFGSTPGAIDTLVLGCTHYVFAQERLRALLGPGVALVATSQAVARQTRRLLDAASLRSSSPAPAHASHRVQLLASGDAHGLQAAASRWLGLPAQTCPVLSIAA
jgi:glutamate racemase